jgi:hypothetical protein
MGPMDASLSEDELDSIEINNNQSINTVLEGVLRFQVTSLYETSE